LQGGAPKAGWTDVEEADARGAALQRASLAVGQKKRRRRRNKEEEEEEETLIGTVALR
jgi:hypothetical protein